MSIPVSVFYPLYYYPFKCQNTTRLPPTANDASTPNHSGYWHPKAHNRLIFSAELVSQKSIRHSQRNLRDSTPQQQIRFCKPWFWSATTSGIDQSRANTSEQPRSPMIRGNPYQRDALGYVYYQISGTNTSHEFY
jgi:hypothetical protein